VVALGEAEDIHVGAISIEHEAAEVILPYTTNGADSASALQTTPDSQRVFTPIKRHLPRL
jgi:hypothetical protein